ncbi:MAG: hypothetical protein AAB536_01250 [Patescibacteria group bacterium]
MKASGKAKQTRSFSDIHPAPKSRGIFRRFHDFTVNLKPSFYEKYRPVFLLVVVAIVIGGTFMIRNVLTKAELADFYPATCLGTWQNPSGAQGLPETIDNVSPSFNESNSAVYRQSDSEGDKIIFCGSFIPSDFEVKGDVKNVALSLVWQIGESVQTNVQSETEIISSGETPPAPSPSSSDSVVPETTPTSTPENSSSTTSFLFNIFSKFLNKAFAQEVSSTTSGGQTPQDNTATQQPVSASSENTTDATTTDAPSQAPNAKNDSLESANILNIFSQENSPETGSSTKSSSSGEPFDAAPLDITRDKQGGQSDIAIPIQAPIPDENFIQINYSTDGQNWVELQKVSPQNWRDLKLTIPVSKWDELKTLQIQAKIILTSLNPVPVIYLDGMLLKVNYDVPPAFANTANIELEQPRIIQVSPNVTMEIPPPVPAPFVPPPTIVSITKTADTVHVKIQYLGDFYGQSLNVFLYPADIELYRNGTDNGFSFGGVQDKSFLDSAQLYAKDFDPITKQAEFDIVAPDANPDYGIKTSEMIPGKYAVDAAYYDSQTRHLIPAQMFDWP